MARFDQALLASALLACALLGASSGDPLRGGAPGMSAELSQVAWTAGDDARLLASDVRVDLRARTAVTSLTGWLGGVELDVQTLRLGQPETLFERLKARGSVTERALESVQVERLDVSHGDLVTWMAGQGQGQLTSPPAATPASRPSGLTLEIRRGGLRLSLSGVAWLEDLGLSNDRGDRLTIKTVSIPAGGEEWTCDDVRIVEAGRERRFERLIFVAQRLELIEPQGIADRLSDIPPQVALKLTRWE